MSRRVCAIFWESRWPEAFRCPRCGGRGYWPIEGRALRQCDQCNYQVSPTAGTLMHRTRFPLKEWFWAAYLVATHTPGMSATQLQRQMGCSYKTAWFLLQRLRRGMVNANRSRLRGRVEADEVFIGGPVSGKRGRGVARSEHRTLVFGAVEVLVYSDKHGYYMERVGRLRLAKAERADETSIRRFLSDNVEVGTEIDYRSMERVFQKRNERVSSRVPPSRNPCPAHSSGLRQSANLAERHSSRCRCKIPAKLSR